MKKSFTDKAVLATVSFLTRIILRPEVRYEDDWFHGKALGQPCILVCNHTSHLDGPVLNTVLRKNEIHTLAAKDRFEQRGFGFFLRHTGCIPIDRQHADTSWIHGALKVLKVDKECVAIYPEGRHGSHRQQLPFHSGVSLLAVMAGVPVVMVYLDGPFRFFHRSRLLIGKPFNIEVPSDGLSADFAEAQTRQLEKRMQELQRKFEESEH